MSFEIVTVPCLEDNYAYLLIADGRAVVVDIPEAAPILAAVRDHGVYVTDVLITHHHDDHIQDLGKLLTGLDAEPRIIGPKADAHRLPPLDLAVEDGDKFTLGNGAEVTVLEVPGHTLGHVAYHVPEAKAAFTADSLMALGCGRVFEGTMEQMWASLSKLARLPKDTTICSGHEYTASNGRFALTIEPDNPDLKDRVARVAALREKGQPTVPSQLAEELATNPFLRAGLAEVKENLDMAGMGDADVFAEIRRRKDSF
jgi:hydroxyacylglutathione hydrolase